MLNLRKIPNKQTKLLEMVLLPSLKFLLQSIAFLPDLKRLQIFLCCDFPDPCLNDGVVSYDIEDLCSGYVMCVDKRSMRACCDINHAYVAGIGCVFNPTCIDTCHGDNNRLVHPESKSTCLLFNYVNL